MTLLFRKLTPFLYLPHSSHPALEQGSTQQAGSDLFSEALQDSSKKVITFAPFISLALTL